MRKIVAAEFISLDGVIEGANQLTGQYFSDELQQYFAAGAASTDALLMGRVTYPGVRALLGGQDRHRRPGGGAYEQAQVRGLHDRD